MKLKDLMSAYKQAEVKSIAQREAIETINCNVVRATYTKSGLPVIEVDADVKYYDSTEDAFAATRRIVLFDDDMSYARGVIASNFAIEMLNGIKTKVRINVVGYVDADGNAGTTHETFIKVNDKELTALIDKCNRNVAPTNNPF